MQFPKCGGAVSVWTTAATGSLGVAGSTAIGYGVVALHVWLQSAVVGLAFDHDLNVGPILVASVDLDVSFAHDLLQDFGLRVVGCVQMERLLVAVVPGIEVDHAAMDPAPLRLVVDGCVFASDPIAIATEDSDAKSRLGRIWIDFVDDRALRSVADVRSCRVPIPDPCGEIAVVGRRNDLRGGAKRQ